MQENCAQSCSVPLNKLHSSVWANTNSILSLWEILLKDFQIKCLHHYLRMINECNNQGLEGSSSLHDWKQSSTTGVQQFQRDSEEVISLRAENE